MIESENKRDTLLGKNKEFTFQRGFQSTSLSKEQALNFADPTSDPEINPDIVSVLLKIELEHRKNFYIYDGDSSAFKNEQEVILQEGLKFKIVDKQLKQHKYENWSYYEIHMIYHFEK